MFHQEIVDFNAFYSILLTFSTLVVKYLNANVFEKLYCLVSEFCLLILVSSVSLYILWVLWNVIKAKYILPPANFQDLLVWAFLVRISMNVVLDNFSFFRIL